MAGIDVVGTHKHLFGGRGPATVTLTFYDNGRMVTTNYIQGGSAEVAWAGTYELRGDDTFVATDDDSDVGFYLQLQYESSMATSSCSTW